MERLKKQRATKATFPRNRWKGSDFPCFKKYRTQRIRPILRASAVHDSNIVKMAEKTTVIAFKRRKRAKMEESKEEKEWTPIAEEQEKRELKRKKAAKKRRKVRMEKAFGEESSRISDFDETKTN
jgi:hypothetical protein